MAEVRESFPILEDFSTQAGLPLHKVLEGDAAASKNALAGLVAKDNSGNLIYLKTNADGELVVSLEAGDRACVSDHGTNTGSASNVDLATAVLQNDLSYEKVGWSVSCFRDSVFQIVQIDDAAGTPTETVHAELRVGPGHYNDSEQLDCLSFTGGSTGDIELVIRGKNENALSNMSATISVEEIQAAP